MELHETLTDRLVDLFKALADPSRLRILGLLAERAPTGKELSETLAIGAPTISHHVAKLADARLVQVTRDGQSRIYTLNEAVLRTLTQLASVRGGGAVEADPGATKKTSDRSATVGASIRARTSLS